MKAVLCIVLCGLGLCLSSDLQCDWSVRVDEVHGSDCGVLETPQRNQTCSSLEDTFKMASSVPSFSCMEVIVGQGSYQLEEAIFIQRSMFLYGKEGHDVVVDLVMKPSVTFQYSLSFSNAASIQIENIHFTGGEGVIGFDSVGRVQITNCSFRYFTQGAVDIYNSKDILVEDSIFEHNGPVNINKGIALRGHSGGLSLAFDFREPIAGVAAIVADVISCTFHNNSATASRRTTQTTNQVLRRFLLTGRGGGCAINMRSVIPLNITVAGCTFERNFALSFGGGLYFTWTFISNHVIIVANTSFLENVCKGGAGGLELGFTTRESEDTVSNRNMFFASDLRFVGNQANYGGGTFYFIGARRVRNGSIGSVGSFRNCVFEGNTAVEYGGAIGLNMPSFGAIFSNRENIQPIEFTNCSFTRNDGGHGGVVSTGHLPLTFDGYTVFSENRGASLAILGAIVRLYGQFYFFNNDASTANGGAIYAVSLGQIKLGTGSELNFVNNSGNFGSGIVVNTIFVPRLYIQFIHNPLCVILLEDQSLSFSDVNPDNISVAFSGNKALVGSAVYSNHIGLCSWTGVLGGNEEYFNDSLAFKWKFFKYSNNNQNIAHFPPADPQYYVQTDEGRFQVATTEVSTYPGETLPFEVKVVDELNLSTVGFFRFSDEGAIENQLKLEFSPSIVSLRNVSEAINLSVFVSNEGSIEGTTNAVAESLLRTNSDSTSFYVNVTQCPPGYVISNFTSRLRKCECEVANEGIINCDNLDIQIKDGHWASTASNVLHTYPCPHHYCRCHVFESEHHHCARVLKGGDPDSQCVCDRRGTLCGSCIDGKGVSVLLNQCTSCSNASALLIIMLILADIFFYVALIVLSIQFPAWLFPCLLYIQSLPLYLEFFPPVFGVPYNILLYIGSALSFYFVYDFCLFDGMTPVQSYFIRYIPPLIALIVCPLTYLIMRCKFCKQYRGLKRKYKEWHGIWWVVNLLYTHVVFTSSSILSCPSINVALDQFEKRWHVSGETKCFQGPHLALSVVAIVSIVICFLAIPFAAIASTRKVKALSYLKKPLSRSFRDRYSWWSSIELGRKFILIISIVAFPANNYPTTLVISVFIVLTGLAWPYKDIWSNVLDLVLSADTVFLLLLRSTGHFEKIFNDVVVKTNGVASSDQCMMMELQPPALSYVLIPIYFLPLLLSVMALSIWIILLVRKRLSKANRNDLLELDERLESMQLTRSELMPTKSEILLEEFAPENENYVTIGYNQVTDY